LTIKRFDTLFKMIFLSANLCENLLAPLALWNVKPIPLG
jgi:hypothetical protein